MDVIGQRYGYGVCEFSFLNFNLGSGVSVIVKGANALEIKIDGNATIDTEFSLDGESGISGVYSGNSGPGGWQSGRGIRNSDGFSNIHPALNGQGPGRIWV